MREREYILAIEASFLFFLNSITNSHVGLGGGGGQVVSVLTSNYNNPSSNLAEVYLQFFNIIAIVNQWGMSF